MSDIFREVDEALQQEKVAKIWKEYGPTFIAAAVILVLSTAATTAWVSWNKSRNATETARLITAMEQNDDAAKALEDMAQDTRDKQGALALLTAAGMEAGKSNFDKSAALYKDVYEQSGAPRELRDLARILNVRSTLAAAGAKKDEETTLSSSDLIAVLDPVLKNEKGPWVWMARIDAALIKAHLDQDYKAAAAYLDGAKDIKGAPPSLTTRAQALYQLYSAQASATENKDAQG